MVTLVAMSWSGGKDSCLALHELQLRPDVDVVVLVTTMALETDRVGLHHVRRELIDRQALAIGVPLRLIYIPTSATNAEYEAAMAAGIIQLREQGIEQIAFGDLFLEDIRAYREALMARNGVRSLYPLWGSDTRALAAEFVAQGFKAVTTCVDARKLDVSFLGRIIDDEFLAKLPANVDPCGENGEFHSFVYDGPNFRRPVEFALGELIVDGTFNFCDLLPLPLPPLPS